MKIIIAVAFCFLYWGVCFLGTGTDKKNLISLRSYWYLTLTSSTTAV